jgi:hypothetical protein
MSSDVTASETQMSLEHDEKPSVIYRAAKFCREHAFELLVDALGLAIFILAFLNRIPVLWAPVNAFDEGLLLTISSFVQDGGVLYRDVYTNYPPGIYLLILCVWKLVGVSVLAIRVLGLSLHVGIALLVGRLAGRALGRRICWLPAGVSLAWIRALELIPFAWLAALLVLLCAAELAARAVATRQRATWFWAGVVLAIVSWFRHDLFVYAIASATLPLFGLWWQGRARAESIRPLVMAATAGVLVGLIPFWIPLLFIAGPRRVIGDLVLDQIRYVMPARKSPLPALTRIVRSSFGLPLPAFLNERYEGAVALCMAGPVFASGIFLLRRRFLTSLGTIAVAVLAAMSLAVLPQMLGRTDPNHALCSLAPGLALAYVCFEAIARRLRWPPTKWIAFSCGILLFANPIYARIWPIPSHLVPRADPARALPVPSYGRIGDYSPAYAAARRSLLEFVHHNSAPGDAVYFGTPTHRQVDVNEADLYFLVGRRPGTRFVYFDPSMVTRREVQQEMIQDLQRNRVRVVVTSTRVVGGGPPTGGSDLLDEYIRANFEHAGSAGFYTFMLRKS